ncbi:MAG: pitrilysin family protein [Candidatus Liptonbacteria bacterium]|nr:pitrilysin family protein [Candidatus Liptonbacteria bacterium]
MEFERAMTDCGAPLYVLPMPHAQSVATGILVNAGTRDENWPKQAGLAHAFEHMAFHGNPKFRTSADVTAFVEEVGGGSNAFTGKELTFFFNVVPTAHALRGPVNLYHLLSEPLFKQEKILTEMQNIVEEIKMNHDSPELLVDIIFNEAIYGDHPLGRCELGDIESVSAFTRDDLAEYHEKFYHPGNFTFLVVGNIEAAMALDSFNALFKKTGHKNSNVRPEGRAIRGGQNKRYVRKDIEQVHLCLGGAIGPANSRSTMALELFKSMIDGGMSFPLFQEVRDKLGLCYDIRADITPWSDHGIVTIYAGTDRKRWRETVQAILEVLKDSANDEALFRKAKQLVVGRTALKFESPTGIIQHAAFATAFRGKPQSPKEIINEIEGISFEEVASAVGRYLRSEDLVQTFVGPKDFEP